MASADCVVRWTGKCHRGGFVWDGNASVRCVRCLLRPHRLAPRPVSADAYFKEMNASVARREGAEFPPGLVGSQLRIYSNAFLFFSRSSSQTQM